MITLVQTQFALQPWWLQVLIGLLIGVAMGQLFFRSLNTSVKGFLAGSIATALRGYVVRFGILIPVLVLLAWLGKFALLAGTMGITLARLQVVRSVRQAT